MCENSGEKGRGGRTRYTPSSSVSCIKTVISSSYRGSGVEQVNGEEAKMGALLET